MSSKVSVAPSKQEMTDRSSLESVPQIIDSQGPQERKKKTYLVKKLTAAGEDAVVSQLTKSDENNASAVDVSMNEQTFGSPADPSKKKKKMMVVRKARPGEDLLNPNIRVIDPKTLNLSNLPFKQDAKLENQQDSLVMPAKEINELSVLGNPASFEKTYLSRSGKLSLSTTQGQSTKSMMLEQYAAIDDQSQSPGFGLSRNVLASGKITPLQQDELKRSLKTLKDSREEDSKREKDRQRKLKIFERVGNNREVNSLDKYQQAEAEWERVKQRLAKVTGKTEDQLVLATSADFRIRQEEAELIERSLPLFYDRGKEKMAKGGMVSQIERIVNPKTGRPTSIKSWENSEYLRLRKRQLEKFMKEFAEPTGDLKGLIVEGESIIPLKVLEELSTIPATDNVLDTSTSEPALEDASRLDQSPRAQNAKNVVEYQPITLPSSRILIEAPLGVMTSSSFAIHNDRSYVIYYAWERLANRSAFRKPVDNLQRFFFGDTVGSILPGEKHEFTFTFKSERPGIFFDYWRFHTTPKVEGSGTTLVIKGISVDNEERDSHRKQLDDEISSKVVRRSMNVLVYDFLDLISVPEVSYTIEETTNDFAAEFERLNSSLGVLFDPDSYSSFENLARIVASVAQPSDPPVWDNKITTISQWISSILDLPTQLRLSHELDVMIRDNCISKPAIVEDSANYFNMYGLLTALVDDICETGNQYRKKYNLAPRSFSLGTEEEEEEELQRTEAMNRPGGLRIDIQAIEEEEAAKKKKKGKPGPPSKKDEPKTPALQLGKDKDKEKDKAKDKGKERETEKDADKKREIKSPGWLFLLQRAFICDELICEISICRVWVVTSVSFSHDTLRLCHLPDFVNCFFFSFPPCPIFTWNQH
eukprot:TRINITY_DN6113_c0_g1_i3.p1 TRINITY_DN6113_c0_g1~~TRINITY_DN6113_c0_g1_i3.p1  ORF type:complete len:873 (+),score=209.41 TRINITY_DN6113_c0_g1_i3:53-2671(+)